MQMSVRERILTIRLMDKANANPAHVEAFGILIVNHPARSGTSTALNSENPTS